MMNLHEPEKMPQEDNVSYRLRVIQELLKIRSVAAFANEIGVDTSVLNNIMSPFGRKGKPSFDTLLKIALKYPRVNMDWLITGKGEPLRPFSPVERKTPLLQLQERVSSGNEHFTGNLTNQETNYYLGTAPENPNQERKRCEAELLTLLKVSHTENENLKRILLLKDELIEVLRNQK